jgi:tol-pal system protein YbgF
MIKRPGIVFLLIALGGGLPLRAQKSKQVYELIYQDIQFIKQQLERLDEQVQRNSEDILTLSKQIGEILRLTRDARTEFAGFRAEQKDIPAQYQILIQRYDAIRAELTEISEKLLEIERASPVPGETEAPPGEAEQADVEDTAAVDRAVEDALPEPQPKTTLPPNLSPQEIYNMARSDYLKGNFELAIEGFTIYKEHFPESPLVDNAVYWIGECYFSQERYEEAVAHFNELILRYPKGDKIAAAYLKKGFSLANLGKTDEALAVLKLLVSKFPLEDETKLAQQKIQELEKRI